MERDYIFVKGDSKDSLTLLSLYMDHKTVCINAYEQMFHAHGFRKATSFKKAEEENGYPIYVFNYSCANAIFSIENPLLILQFKEYTENYKAVWYIRFGGVEHSHVELSVADSLLLGLWINSLCNPDVKVM